MGNYVIQMRKPGRKWRTIETSTDKAMLAEKVRELKATQEGVSQWDAIQYALRMG